MDFFKKSCRELCEKLLIEEIANTGQLDDFVKTKCNFYNNSKNDDEENDAVINKEKAILKPIYDALEIKPNAGTINKTYYTNADFTQDHTGIDNAKNEDKPLIYERTKKYAKYWEKLKNATDELGRRANVKFFSIFLGVGTGQYYREASSKINTKLNGIKTNIAQVKKALSNSAKEDPEQKSPQPQPSDPGMFRGLPNGSTYCYLNTALQELYHDLPNFRTKVLNAQVPDITTGHTDEYKELRATQFFFKYLQDPTSMPTFNKERNSYAKLLGYKNGKHGSSSEAKSNIELKCRDQMRKLKDKSSLTRENESSATNFRLKEGYVERKFQEVLDNYKDKKNQSLTAQEKTDIIKTSKFISQLYRDKEFKDRIDVIDKNELNLKGTYVTLETIKELFRLKDDGKTNYYSKAGCELIYKIRGQKTCADLKKKVLNEIKEFERSKRAHVLSIDSNILIDGFNRKNNVIDSLKNYFNGKRKDNMAYYLPLKNNRFSVTFSDSAHTGRVARKNFEVLPELHLTNLVKDNVLKIFVKGEELEKTKYKFDLISASIGTGRHYYLYKKVNTTNDWKKIDDSHVRNCRWDDIKKEISKLCETLTYELKP